MLCRQHKSSQNHSSINKFIDNHLSSQRQELISKHGVLLRFMFPWYTIATNVQIPYFFKYNCTTYIRHLNLLCTSATSKQYMFQGTTLQAIVSLDHSASKLDRFLLSQSRPTEHLHWNQPKKEFPLQLQSQKAARDNFNSLNKRLSFQLPCMIYLYLKREWNSDAYIIIESLFRFLFKLSNIQAWRKMQTLIICNIPLD